MVNWWRWKISLLYFNLFSLSVKSALQLVLVICNSVVLSINITKGSSEISEEKARFVLIFWHWKKWEKNPQKEVQQRRHVHAYSRSMQHSCVFKICRLCWCETVSMCVMHRSIGWGVPYAGCTCSKIFDCQKCHDRSMWAAHDWHHLESMLQDLLSLAGKFTWSWLLNF